MNAEHATSAVKHSTQSGRGAEAAKVLHTAEMRAATMPLTHHGRTPAAWTGSIVAFVGAIIGSVGFLMNINWTVVWVGVAIFALSAVVGGLMVKLGYGAGGAKSGSQGH